jgi:hypothetical protein
VITKLQLAGILMAERTLQKKPDARKNRRNALHSKMVVSVKRICCDTGTVVFNREHFIRHF